MELAEAATALRSASRRSLVCMDELGRGTSTFDGTAIAFAAVQHLVEKNRCLAIFTTHYHSLLTDFKADPRVRLGHMQSLVGGSECISVEDEVQNDDATTTTKDVEFLYTLGDGACPNSFGINVARVAGLPKEVLSRAKAVSSSFEAEMNDTGSQLTVTHCNLQT